MGKLTIGLFTDNFRPTVGGTEVVVEKLAENLSILGHKVYVIAPNKKAECEDRGCPYTVLRSKALKVFPNTYAGMIALSGKLKKEVNKINFDIIHCHSVEFFCSYAIKVAKQKDIPLVNTVHTNFRDVYQSIWFMKPISKMLLAKIGKKLNKSDQIVTVCKNIHQELKSWGVKSEAKVIKNATCFDYETVCEQSKNVLGLKDEFVVLYVGRVEPYKNIQFTMQALGLLKDKLNFKFLIVGDGTYTAKLKSLAKQLGIFEKVKFLGRVDDDKLKQIYARSNLYAIPNKFDTDSLTIIEAAVYRTPSVVLENTGISERITNNVNGYTIKEDAQEFADKIFQLANNLEQTKQVGLNAFKEIPKTWLDVAKEYESLYNEVLSYYKSKQKCWDSNVKKLDKI